MKTERKALLIGLGCLLLISSNVNALPGWSKYIKVPGVGHEGQGAGMELVNLDSNPRPELIFMAYDNPQKANNFRYKIGWNISTQGLASSWSNYTMVPGVGWEGQGAGITMTNLDSNSRPEMILMAYDNPSKSNNFRYKIGWNVNSSGKATSWSNYTMVPGVGWEGQGAGIAMAALDSNPRPDMILMAYDNPSKGNSFRYKIGWNVNSSGKATSWSPYKTAPGVGWEGQGAGVTLTDLDGNSRPEMVLLAYDNPSQANNFRYRVGWNLNASGNATSWSHYVKAPGVGWEGQGSDIKLSDIDNDGNLDMLLMAYDAPSGANDFRYRIGWDVRVVDDFLLTLDTLGHSNYQAPTQIPSSLATQTAANLYQLSDSIVLQTAYEAILEYVNDCHANPAAHANEVDNAAGITFYDVLTDPDAMVAAVAWFVDRNMRWTSDANNANILNNQMGLNYNPGWDFPIPANYTITYTGDAAFGNPARFHGDCEDHAILRAALLRALGFNPDYIWNVIDNPVSHEYNIVAYQGRFRIMDYGTIDRWLATHTWDSHRSHYGYTETYGKRGTGNSQHNNLVNHGNNYPDGAPRCAAWDYDNYYADTCR
ncbi:MAG: hypothetical protein KZQ80_04405 [Candidatus Thiodiazotropha sp. (ex Monitilora ramsayi)]|nr:hypothetical protein [Candidatus Thiodiazotropha sp. (ex Monitilora ramsayi)]